MAEIIGATWHPSKTHGADQTKSFVCRIYFAKLPRDLRILVGSVSWTSRHFLSDGVDVRLQLVDDVQALSEILTDVRDWLGWRRCQFLLRLNEGGLSTTVAIFGWF